MYWVKPYPYERRYHRGYLRHILECIRRIEVNVAGGREPFMASHTLQDAVLGNLQTMTESTQRLSDTLKAAHPDVEWRRIIAFRNILVHDYLGIDWKESGRLFSVTFPASSALSRRC
jgi:uncharacterized protein with HEPN domain